MSKWKRSFKRGRDRQRKLKHKGVSPEVVDSIASVIGREPTVADAEDIGLQMVQELLRSTVELQIAQWMHMVLCVLRDDFGMDQGQLALFAQRFRDEMNRDEEETETLDSDNGKV